MDEGTSGGGASRLSPSYVKKGDRQIFSVELRSGDTTFVSWKKLMKDANKVNTGFLPVSEAPPPPPNAHPNLESRLAPPGQPAENEGKDGPHRFSAVIEKIERLYKGRDSSDDEDLKDVPDDDQYDTDDSFIDDAELDEYFEVDNSAIKHNGFFVNRGRLERITEPTAPPNQQVKKRRRKDINKAPGENDDGHTSTKQVKMSKTEAGKAVLPLGKNTSNPSQSLAVTSEHHDDAKSQNLPNAPGVSSKRKSAEIKMNLDPSASIKVSNGDASVSLADANDMEKLKTGGLQSKNVVNKPKDASGSVDASHHKYLDKSVHPQLKVQSSKAISIVEEVEQYVRPKEKNGVLELPDLNMPDSRVSMQVSKPSYIHRRDGSSVRSKSSALENAIRELEKMVAESRPPALDNQDADAQAIKRRLPREIKLKLAKVARLAQASQGKVTKDLLNRLMSSLGHLIQLRTLKRNLKVMISMGLSAKEEKDVRFQQMKKELAELVKARGPSSESKSLEQQAGASDDFQEIGGQEKGALKRKFSMETVLEDKICDLYDCFVNGLDEDSGPQVRKLYIELAGLWPSGSMDNHGIKRAICRAKERRNRHKEEEKIKRKKMMAPRLDETTPRAESGSAGQQQYMCERSATDTNASGPVLALASKSLPSSTAVAVRVPSPAVSAPTSDRMKQVKPKGNSSNPMEEAKMGVDGALTNRKLQPEMINETQPFVSMSHEENLSGLQQPSGSMDNHGIKHAICKAKEERRDVFSRHKEQEKIKRKITMTPRLDDTTARVETGSTGQQQYTCERSATDTTTSGPLLALSSKSLPSSTAAAVRVPSHSTLDKIKRDKPKGSSSNPMEEAKIGRLTKKKVKRKPEPEMMNDTRDYVSVSSEERVKSHKQVLGLLSQKLNLELTAPPNFR
ncbi:wound-responsive family protein [Euphorbia peplus]|nr:wound-responsive family protein [Euphorbia peplus]